MSNTEVDQSRAYREYFELVQEFNSANDKYITTINEAQERRRRVIEKAIKAHIDPFVSNLRSVQVIGVIAGIMSGLFLCVGLIAEWNGFIIFILLVIGGIGVIGLAWSSSKISKLVSDTHRAKEHLPRLPDSTHN